MSSFNAATYCEELLRELNALRADPEKFAERVLIPMLPHFSDLKYAPPGASAVRTYEGAAAVKEAIDVCRSKSPLSQISRVSSGLTRSASDLVQSNGPRGALDNVMADGTTIGQRIVRYGKWRGKASETISFGNYPPAEAIAQWVIDDGNASRSQQATLLEPRYQVVGIACGPHKTYNLMTVVIFAEDFEEGADASDLKYSTTSTSSRSLDRHLDSGAPAADGHGASRAPAAATSPSSATSTSSPHSSSTSSSTSTSASHPPASSSAAAAASSTSKKGESVLESEGARFVLETEALDHSIHAENLSLKLEGRSLALTIENRAEGHTRTLKWELPFEPHPGDIEPKFHDHRVKILIAKPNREVAERKERVAVGSFELPALSGGGTHPEFDVEQTETDFLCKPKPSKFAEKIVVEHHNGDELKFISTHTEEVVEDGERITKECTLTRTIRLPYPVPASNVSIQPGNITRIRKAITHSGHSAVIPIH